MKSKVSIYLSMLLISTMEASSVFAKDASEILAKHPTWIVHCSGAQKMNLRIHKPVSVKDYPNDDEGQYGHFDPPNDGQSSRVYFSKCTKSNQTYTCNQGEFVLKAKSFDGTLTQATVQMKGKVGGVQGEFEFPVTCELF